MHSLSQRCTELTALLKKWYWKKSRFAIFFTGGSDIGKNFTATEKSCDPPSDTCIVVTCFFVGKSKVIFNRKPFAIFCGTWSAAGTCRCQFIHYRSNPCITDKVKFWIFINNVCLINKLSHRMMTCSFSWNSGITCRIIDAASSSLDYFSAIFGILVELKDRKSFHYYAQVRKALCCTKQCPFR